MHLKRSSIAALFAASIAPAWATTKGLNQIVTPDIQPAGTLSISYQEEDQAIGNPTQVQLELGITKRFEIAAFEGFSPQETFLAAEYGIIQQKQYLLSTGFLNYTSMGSSPQPFLEGGYIQGSSYFILGATYVIVQGMGTGGTVRNFHQTQAILGYAYRTAPRLLLQADYQTGSGNFSTVGFTYNISPELQINPSLYFANTTGHAVYGYAVMSWNIDVFNPGAHAKPKVPAPVLHQSLPPQGP
jgi:hypothetical protein